VADPRRVEAAVAAVLDKMRTEKRGNNATPMADARTLELIRAALRAYDEYDGGECHACNCTDCRRERSRGRNAR
jgi:hypothetical protein